MNNLINELTGELQSNTGINTSVAVKIVLESINNSILLGVPSEQILENALANLAELADATVNENLKEVVSRFMKMAEKPTKSLQNMAKEVGISLKIKALKESSLQKDPVFAHAIAALEQKLAVLPEFRVIGMFVEALSKFSYDPGVEIAIEEVLAYVNENRAKLEIINAIFEMRQTGAVLYRDSIVELENCLLEENFTADIVKMKLRGKTQMPVVNRLVNTLSMVEAKEVGLFNIGVGNGETKIKSVVAPFCKISESDAVVFIDNKFIKLSESADPTQIEEAEIADHIEFFAVCEAFSALNFKEKESEIVAKGRVLEVAFVINENGTLSLKINGSVVEDLSKVQLTEIFLMEHVDVRSQFTKLFNGLDMIVNLEFAKKLVNERLSSDSIVLNLEDKIFVLEKQGNGRFIKSMESLAFHNYVMEKFNYDVSELYAIELEDREQFIRKIEEEKQAVEADLTKLERSIEKLDEALAGTDVTDEYRTQLEDLKVSIEKNVNSLRNHYITLDQSKKKV